MKAKTHPQTSRRNLHRDEPLPHELGVHLFAVIKRNLLARRERRPSPAATSQLTFAF
jgi:hypothetical protein